MIGRLLEVWLNKAPRGGVGGPLIGGRQWPVRVSVPRQLRAEMGVDLSQCCCCRRPESCVNKQDDDTLSQIPLDLHPEDT
jgi:hypothetical protein